MRLFKYQVDRIARDGSLVRLGRNVLLPGVGSCFTCTCKAVRHAHVGQYDMCMWSSETCTCKTMQLTGEQGRRIKMRCPVKVLTGIIHPRLLTAITETSCP